MVNSPRPQELEYPEGHTSRSVYVALPVHTPGAALMWLCMYTCPINSISLLFRLPRIPVCTGHSIAASLKQHVLICAGQGIPDGLKQHMDGAAIAIWTTTPWTMPANLAVAVNGKLQYALVQAEVCSSRYSFSYEQYLIKHSSTCALRSLVVATEAFGSSTWCSVLQDGRKLFVAVDLVEALQQKLGCAPLQQLGSLTGVCWSQMKTTMLSPCSNAGLHLQIYLHAVSISPAFACASVNSAGSSICRNRPIIYSIYLRRY